MFSMLQGYWSVIATTDKAYASSGKSELSEYLDIPSSELDFMLDTIQNDVALPLAVVGRRGEKCFPILIFRKMLFETSMCIALELSSAEELSRVLSEYTDSDILASDAARELAAAKEYSDVTYFDALADVCRLVALNAHHELVDYEHPTAYSDLVLHVIRDLLDVEMNFDYNVVIPKSYESGRLFANGFCMYLVFALTMAAGAGSRISITLSGDIDSAHVIVDVLCVCANKERTLNDLLLMQIAQAYGIPLDIKMTRGEIECRILPQYADEAYKGVKDDGIPSETVQTDLEYGIKSN